MEKSQKLANFIKNSKSEDKELPKTEETQNMNESDGLVEKFDRKIVNSKGKQLLREQLFENNTI
jgi:hypothetical protein